ncbi:scavenger receptor cysteine-rich domain-containing protein DMBT1-like [Haliotis cracherodii]|uniref:scavenger receptor cysteine-rich domain-containing protein DMBT1-like n=1 Tax=Haliotis cracherodii TaxID=6455 RepID=UPI0039ECDA38
MAGCMRLALFLLFATTTAKAEACDVNLQVNGTKMVQAAVVASSGTCTWTITNARTYGSVLVTFEDVNMTHYPSCDVGNSVVVYDGDSSGDILGLVCGNYSSSFRSSGSFLTVRYSAAVVTDTDAFVLAYIHSLPGTCSGPSVTAVSTAEYNILSYGYPEGFIIPYGCYWTVKAPKGQRVRVSIETAGNVSSTCEDVKITFIDFENTGMSVTWCPGRSNVYQSWTNSAYLNLKISKQRSVRLKYRALEGATCRGDDLTAAPEEQFLMTPGYPNPLPSYLECRWTINTPNPRSGAIRIDVLEMDLDTEGCTTDVIRVYDAVLSSRKLVGTTCEGPRSFYVYGRSAVVEFKSLREINTKQGFKLKYYNTTAEPCGGSLVANSTMQNVTSPGYPTNYPNSFKCVWTISTENPEGHVKLTFLEVDLYNVFSSSGDFVRVYDGNSTSGYLLGKVSGKNKPTFTSQEASLTVMFTTDYSGQITLLDKPGFVFGYEETQNTPPMHRLVKTPPASTILSPRYPGEVKDINATWTVRSKWAGNQVLLSFLEVDIGDVSDCDNNYIMVYQGSTSSDVFSKICGNETGKFLNQGMELSVVFRTDSNLARRGFKATQDRPKYGTVDGCYGETNEVTAYSFSKDDHDSPLFPNNYPNMMNCSTLVKSIFDDHYIQLEVTDMNMPHPEDTGCTRDYVEFFDGPSSASPSLGRACGQTLLKVQSTGNEVLVMFISDSNVGDKGYRIKYQADREETPHSAPFGLILGITIPCLVIIGAYVTYLVCKKRKGSASI